jgi:hypothetical protein
MIAVERACLGRHADLPCQWRRHSPRARSSDEYRPFGGISWLHVVYTTGLVQLDSPEFDGATNYELLGNQGDLRFHCPQNSFSISLRDFAYLPGERLPGDFQMITVFGADDTTVLSTHAVGLNKSMITSTDSSESAPIGAVNLSEISGGFWTGILQSVTLSTPHPTPESASLSLLGNGVLALAGMVRRKLIP